MSQLVIAMIALMAVDLILVSMNSLTREKVCPNQKIFLFLDNLHITCKFDLSDNKQRSNGQVHMARLRLKSMHVYFNCLFKSKCDKRYNSPYLRITFAAEVCYRTACLWRCGN